MSKFHAAGKISRSKETTRDPFSSAQLLVSFIPKLRLDGEGEGATGRYRENQPIYPSSTHCLQNLWRVLEILWKLLQNTLTSGNFLRVHFPQVRQNSVQFSTKTYRFDVMSASFSRKEKEQSPKFDEIVKYYERLQMLRLKRCKSMSILQILKNAAK